MGILKAILERFGVGHHKDGTASKLNSVANVVAEENYSPIISNLSYQQELDLLIGTRISNVSLMGHYNLFARPVTKKRAKVKRKNVKKQGKEKKRL